MTKPNDFVFNSDYLPLAEVDKADFTAYFPAETFPAGQAYDRTQDFKVPYSPGSIDTFLLSLNGGNYNVGAIVIISVNKQLLSIRVQRIDQETIRVRLHEFTQQPGGYSMPAQTLKVKVSSFRPPNAF